jgi:hypothetical protein
VLKSGLQTIMRSTFLSLGKTRRVIGILVVHGFQLARLPHRYYIVSENVISLLIHT